MTKRRTFLAFLAVCFLPQVGWAQEAVRVATYNIKFLNADVGDTRRANLLEVIDRLEADVIGLVEIADRAALRRLFPTDDWQLVIDDQSGDSQDPALAVRFPLHVKGKTAADVDAEDGDFLFRGSQLDSEFPKQRDLLCVEIEIPDGGVTFWVMVHHAKSRLEGRATTDSRRIGAAQEMIKVLERDFDERNYFLVGDFNDNPDDASLNVLETGNPFAPGGAENSDGPFLINLTETLVAEDRVSHGRNSANIVGSDGFERIDTVDPGSRNRNNEARGTDENTGDILFDQILIPVRMRNWYVAGSVAVFDHPSGARGNNGTRASDHLPVSAEFVFAQESDDDTSASAGVRIVSLLPNPDGPDAGHEEVTLMNATATEASLVDWTLRDRAGNTLTLSGSIAGNAKRTLALPDNKLPLNNDGDELDLFDQGGTLRQHVLYTALQVHPGQVVSVE